MTTPPLMPDFIDGFSIAVFRGPLWDSLRRASELVRAIDRKAESTVVNISMTDDQDGPALILWLKQAD